MVCAAGLPDGRWCPLEDAGHWSTVTYSYCASLIKLGYRKPLQLEDLWDLPRDHEADIVCEELASQLEATKDQVKSPQVMHASALRLENSPICMRHAENISCDTIVLIKSGCSRLPAACRPGHMHLYIIFTKLLSS